MRCAGGLASEARSGRATRAIAAVLAAAIVAGVSMWAAAAAEAHSGGAHRACRPGVRDSGRRGGHGRAHGAARHGCQRSKQAGGFVPRTASARGALPDAQAPGGVAGPAESSDPLAGSAPSEDAPPQETPGSSGEGDPYAAGPSEGGLSEGGSPEGGGPPAGSSTEEPAPAEGPTTSEPAGAPAAEPASSAIPFRFFSSTSFWNQPLSSGASPDPHSSALVGALDNEIAREEALGSGPWINTRSYSVPIYTVAAGQATVAVKLATTISALALQAALEAVPLPANAKPAAGTDGELVVWQPATDRIWEFWRLAHTTSGWQAAWGGAMQHESSDSGAFDSSALWPGATTRWGVSASAMSLVGGLISLEDLQKGEINHALSMSLPAIRAGVYASPAQRCDGRSTSSLVLPEGAHLRLDPSLDLAALHLPRLTLMIAQAAQRYGIYIKDGAHNITFDAQDPVSTGTEPYTGPSGYFEGTSPRELLAAFPWSHLEVIDMQLHSTA